MKKIILWLKRHHWIPVYRKDILEYAKNMDKEGFSGLCMLIDSSIFDFNLLHKWKVVLFPLFKRGNALSFGADKEWAYWWEEDDWSGGRMQFLDWLIEQYKNNREDLRKYKAE